MLATAACPICSHPFSSGTLRVREMMFGTRKPFDYNQCSGCGTLKIAKIPEALGDFYPTTYYAHNPAAVEQPSFRKELMAIRDRFCLTGKGFLGWFFNLFDPEPTLQLVANEGRISVETRILDVGCGAGGLLHRFKKAGFKKVMGIDPFLASDVTYKNGLEVKKQSLDDVSGTWDVITLHHVFEHLPDPEHALKRIEQLLEKNGVCIIRIPVADSVAFETYRENWVQLDAPRHLYLHTRKSMELLSQKAGLKLENVIHDSRCIQFWGSEQYQRDIPLYDERSLAVSAKKCPFSFFQRWKWKREAEALNRAGRGDAAAFILRKP